MIMKLIDFYRHQLPPDWYFVDGGEDGHFVYPVGEGLAGLDWTAPELQQDVVVLWNDEGTVMLVTPLNKPDPRCRIFMTASEIHRK